MFKAAFKPLVTALSAAVLAFASSGAAAQEEKVLNIYNWSDYIGEDLIKKFEAETGIKVRYDVFDNNEIVHAKLVAGRTGYDIVVPSSNWGKLQIDGGLLRKLDKDQIPNLKNIDPAVNAQLGKMDPGNNYMVNWLWGFTTVGINVDKVKAALGSTPMPDNVWDLAFKPEYISKLKSCGVSFLDSASEIVPAALHYLGKPSFSKNPSDMAVGWSGDMNIARQRAIDGRTGHKIEALLPKTGGLLFFDSMVIPADAPRPGNAHKFIDFILRAENAAANTNRVFYPNPVSDSKKHIKPDVANNPTVFLSADNMAKMIAPDALNNDMRRLMTRTYTGFKTGL
jgi:putrescine transport system substrate-binding protein